MSSGGEKLSEKKKVIKITKMPEAKEVSDDEVPDLPEIITEDSDIFKCCWESDSNPKPIIIVEKYCSEKEAKKWLMKQKPDAHWTPKIDKE